MFEIRNRVTRRRDDSSGRSILRFTPCLKAVVPIASGELTFAYWEVWEDEPSLYKEAWNKAIDSAYSVVSSINPIMTRMSEDSSNTTVAHLVKMQIDESVKTS